MSAFSLGSRRPVPPSVQAGRMLRLLVLLGFALFFGIPVLWLFLATTRTNNDLLNGPWLGFGSFGNVATAWRHLLDYNDQELLSWIGNSFEYSFGALAISVASCIPAGYALATMRFRGRKALLLATLLAMIMPGSAMVLPLFLEVASAHLLNTALSVILPAAFFPFGVYLTYIYYASSMPPGLLDAGRIDGCREWQLFTRIALPLAKPAVSLVAFFSFVGNWNNYFLPYVMLTDDHKYNLPVGLAALIAGSPGVHPAFASEIPVYGPEEALAGVLTVLPVLLVFLVSQRYMMAGIFGGATKE